MKGMGIVRDHGKAAKIPLAPAHGPVIVHEHTFCECGKVARHGIFCDRCWDEYTGLQRQWDESQARLVDPAYLLRRARMQQFFWALVLMLLGEGLWNFAIGLPINFETVGMSLGWALIVACIAALWHGRKKVEEK